MKQNLQTTLGQDRLVRESDREKIYNYWVSGTSASVCMSKAPGRTLHNNVCLCITNFRQTKREREGEWWPVPIWDQISLAPFLFCLHLFVSKSVFSFLSIHFLFLYLAALALLCYSFFFFLCLFSVSTQCSWKKKSLRTIISATDI